MGNGFLYFLVGLIILLSLADIGLNAISLIPGVGDIAETASESVLEFIQVTLTIVLAVIAGRRTPVKSSRKK